MSQEKKPRKAVARKGVTKKPAEMPIVEAAPLETVFAAPAAKTPARAANKTSAATKVKPRAKAKSLQVGLEDVIRLRAYEIYLQRGAVPGNPHEDWDVAEREVRAHFCPQANALSD